MNIKKLNEEIRKLNEDAEYIMEPQEYKWANNQAKTKIIGAPRGYSRNSDFVFSNTFDEINIDIAADNIAGFGKDEIDDISNKGFIDDWYDNYYIKCFDRDLVNRIVERAKELKKKKGY